MISKYSKRNICGISTQVEEINDDDFDLFFYIIGWESRFVEIVNLLGKSFSSKKHIICSFKQKDKEGFNSTKEKGYDLAKKKEFIDNLEHHIGTNYLELEYKYAEFDKFNDEINEIIYLELEKKKRPLKIGFEMSSCPRYYFLYVLCLCIVKNYTRKISFFYSEGEYSSAPEDDDLDEFFSSYGKTTEIVPYSGFTRKEGKSLFVFSLGFESKFIIDEIIQKDPNYVVFLCANPGYTPEYVSTVEREIKRIVGFCELPDSGYTKDNSAAGDAIDAWKKLENTLYIHIKDAHIVNYVTGTKPHCLAMALNGLVNDNIVVKYRIAEKYKRRDVKSNGIFWRYDITNLSVI